MEKKKIKSSKIVAAAIVAVVIIILGYLFLVGYTRYCYNIGFQEGKAAAVLEIIANDK